MYIIFNHDITLRASHVLVIDCGILNGTILKGGGGGSNDVTLTRVSRKSVSWFSSSNGKRDTQGRIIAQQCFIPFQKEIKLNRISISNDTPRKLKSSIW